MQHAVLKLRLHNRFIHVGVDTSSYVLLIGGRSSYPPLCWLSYGTHVQSVLVIVCVDYPRHGQVLYRTRIIKSCVHHLYLQG